jgi:crotonobetainyl-CoA:carnitine CoA-transferase CaiB-like acyl-CoA transferase
MVLSDYGAFVVKVERPGGGPDAGTLMRKAWERGKWSVEIDLETEEGRTRLHRLVERADIFIESFHADQAARYGVTHDDVTALNPSTIHCAIAGYPAGSPWADRAAYDHLVAARMGLFPEFEYGAGRPLFLGHPSLHYSTGLLAAIGALAALRARRFTGRGQLVSTSLFDGFMAQMPMNWSWNSNGQYYLAREGKKQGLGRTRLICDPFCCADGEWVYVHTGGDGAFKSLMDILGIGDGIRAVPPPEMVVPLDDDEVEVIEHVRGAFLNKTRDEWMKLFREADIASMPALRPGEAMADDQVEFANIVVEIDDPDLGPIRQIGPVSKFSESPAGTPTSAPAVGANNADFAELMARPLPTVSASGEPISQPLEGIRILDFGTFFAVPYGARILSDLGADVIKIEAPGSDPMRALTDAFEGAQRGKRTIAVDLTTDAGRAVVMDLVASADVVLHNFRPGKAEKLGIGYEQVKAINPTIIYSYHPGLGSAGPKSHLKAFAPLMAAFAGSLFEGSGINAPAKRNLGNEDYYNAFLEVLTTLMALEYRAKTGRGQLLETPLLHAALFSQTHIFLDQEGAVLTGLKLDEDRMGWSALYRLYRTSDGWIALACVGDHAFDRLCQALELGDVADDPRFSSASARHEHDAALAERLSDHFAKSTSVEAADVLDRHHVPCEVPLDYALMPEIFWDEWCTETDRVFEQYHEVIGWIREVGLVVHLSEMPGVNKGPGPLLGQHTREIVEGLGYPSERIDQLIADRVFVARDAAT